jgi:hypothetical protein
VKVLLARPHDFVVDAVRDALAALQLQPVVLAHLEDLRSLQAAEFSGAVISIAPTSSVRASVAEVFQRVRASWPTTPLVFTGLSSLASARLGTRAELPGLELFGAHETPSPGAALYLSNTDLLQTRAAALKALAAHLHLEPPR